MLVRPLKKIGELLGKPIESSVFFSSYVTDSRLIKPGDVYCSLPGKKVHGDSFVKEAYSKGAVAALVSSSYQGAKTGREIFVDDVLKALHGMAKRVFQDNRPDTVIAVTGSLGKTTTKEFIAALLQHSMSVFKTPGNANSQIGLPLAILNEFQGQRAAVLEMGMTHFGNITKLVDVAPPDFALITKIAEVHFENFHSLKEIEEAKAEIFSSTKTKIGIYPEENPRLGEFGACVKCHFGSNFADYALFKDKIWKFKAQDRMIPLGILPFEEPHLLHNLLAALAVVHQVQGDFDKIEDKIRQLTLEERRMERIEKKGVIFLNDSYNAAPESVIAALRAISSPRIGLKRIAVLGEMKELGVISENAHRKVGNFALSMVDHLICYGELCLPMVEVWKEKGMPVAHFFDHEEIAEYLRKLAEPGDVVLLKGSKSTQMWTVLDKF